MAVMTAFQLTGPKRSVTNERTQGERRTGCFVESSQSHQLVISEASTFVPGPGKLFKKEDQNPRHQSFMSLAKNVDQKTSKKMSCWKLQAIFEVLKRVFCIVAVTSTPTISGFTCCPENQTAELGKEGIIKCDFPDNFYSVYWYDNISQSADAIVVYLRHNDEKNGPGFKNNTFDVSEDGSLLILEVAVEYERSYAVVLFSDKDHWNTCYVALKVIVYPGSGPPRLECENCQQNYYHLDEGKENLTCSLNISRPAVRLEWIERSRNGDSLAKKQFPNTVPNKDGTFNSSVTVHLTSYGDKLYTVLVCRATWHSWRRGREMQMLVDFSQAESFSSLKENTVYREENRKAEIRCEGSEHASKIWKRISPLHEPETIGFSTGIVKEITTKIPDTEISVEGSLIFSPLHVDHEGLYACLYDEQKVIMTDVVILVPPSPPYIQIIGCKDNGVERCEFREEDTDQVTCAVYGVRHNASLKWFPNQRNQIKLSQSEQNITKRSQTFDVAVSVQYEVSHDVLCVEDILIECHIYGPVANIIKAYAQALIIPKYCQEKKRWNIMEILVYIGIPALLATVIVLQVLTQRQLMDIKDRRNYNNENQNSS